MIGELLVQNAPKTTGSPIVPPLVLTAPLFMLTVGAPSIFLTNYYHYYYLLVLLYDLITKTGLCDLRLRSKSGSMTQSKPLNLITQFT